MYKSRRLQRRCTQRRSVWLSLLQRHTPEQVYFDGAVLHAAQEWEGGDTFEALGRHGKLMEEDVYCGRSGRVVRKNPIEINHALQAASCTRSAWVHRHLNSQPVLRALREYGKNDRVRLWDSAQQRTYAGFTTPLPHNLRAFLLERPHMEVFVGQTSKKHRTSSGGARNHGSVASSSGRPAVGGSKSRRSSTGSSKSTTSSSISSSSASSSSAASVRHVGKINMKDVLSSPTSILTRVDLREIVSLEAVVRILGPSERAALYQLLPEVDRTPEALVSLFRSNMHFVSSLSLCQDLQAHGGFDSDYQIRLRAKRRRSENWTDWKEAQYERFWGHKLDLKPANKEEVAAWKVLDDELVQRAEELLGVEPAPKPNGAAVSGGDRRQKSGLHSV